MSESLENLLGFLAAHMSQCNMVDLRFLLIETHGYIHMKTTSGRLHCIPERQQHINEFESVKNQMNESLEGLLRFVGQSPNLPARVEISFPYSASRPKSQDSI